MLRPSEIREGKVEFHLNDECNMTEGNRALKQSPTNRRDPPGTYLQI